MPSFFAGFFSFLFFSFFFSSSSLPHFLTGKQHISLVFKALAHPKSAWHLRTDSAQKSNSYSCYALLARDFSVLASSRNPRVFRDRNQKSGQSQSAHAITDEGQWQDKTIMDPHLGKDMNDTFTWTRMRAQSRTVNHTNHTEQPRTLLDTLSWTKVARQQDRQAIGIRYPLQERLICVNGLYPKQQRSNERSNRKTPPRNRREMTCFLIAGRIVTAFKKKAMYFLF